MYHRWFLIALLCSAFPFVHAKADERKIAVLIQTGFPGETSFAYRIQSACKNIGWKAHIIDYSQLDHLKKHKHDFVISLVPCHYKIHETKCYLAIFDPIHHYFKPDGALMKRYRHYDGYLLTYSPQQNDAFFTEKIPRMKWYPTVHACPYREPNPTALFHLGSTWGNRFEDVKMQQFLTLLDKEPFTRIYGNPLIQQYCPQHYCSTIPFDSDSLCQVAHEAGVTLLLHSDTHNAHGLPSGRIFEAAAASTVIICDENPFVREHFKDTVLYINTEESAENMLAQVKQHMEWIRANKQAAIEKARQAHAIYKNYFLLEEQLLRLNAFHEEVSSNLFLKWMKAVSARITSFLKNARIATPNPALLTVIPNIDAQYSLVNSIDFHPKRPMFCVSYTHNNKIALYEIDRNHKPQLIQTLCNPAAQLDEPQHAVFSPEGDKMVVANWTSQILNIYASGVFGINQSPIATIPPPHALRECKPHGIAFSPCGKYLAIAYGAGKNFQRGIALFHSDTFQCISTVDHADVPGTPKGISFSPDGTHLLVSLCEPSSLCIFPISNEQINPSPKQIIHAARAQLSRPEDVKISPDGTYCAVSNSDQSSVAFYRFDKSSNSISDATPFYTLRNPEAQLNFPHGIAFSADGNYLAITQFGQVQITEEGDISWKHITPSKEGKINLYLITK